MLYFVVYKNNNSRKYEKPKKPNSMKLLRNLPVLFTIAIAALVTSSAQAVSFDFTSDHVTGGAGTPPFGTVTLTQNGTSVDFNVTLAAGYSFIQTGAADQQYFKFNAIGITVGDIIITSTSSNATFTPLIADTGAFNGDGTGNFAFGISTNPMGNGGPTIETNPITFTVLNSTIADFTNPNSIGTFFVADIIAPAVNGVRNTGPVDAGGTPVVPDGGSTIMLLGAALGGLGAMRRFMRR